MWNERPSSRKAQGAWVIPTCDTSDRWVIAPPECKSRDLRLKKEKLYYRRMTQAIASNDFIIIAHTQAALGGVGSVNVQKQLCFTTAYHIVCPQRAFDALNNEMLLIISFALLTNGINLASNDGR